MVVNIVDVSSSSSAQPRIDPLQLLKCLGVLLTSNGGIRSKEEVQRLASLMMKFSKKLVSKCVYILILKNTETELLGMFMSAGGWTLVFTWLSDGICGKNWALVTELLELLLICPVDVERLKSNSIPRLVKGLSKDESLGGVNVLASKLVEQWLKIVKDETVPDKEIIPIKQEFIVELPAGSISEPDHEVTVDTTPTEIEPQKSLEISPQTFYKVSVKDGKQVIQKVETDPVPDVVEVKEEIVEEQPQKEKENIEKEVKKEERKDEKDRIKDRKKDNHSHDRSKHRSHSTSSRSSTHSHSSSKDKSSSSKDKDKYKDKERHRDKDKDRKNKDKEHRSNGSVKSSSSSNKEKQAEKDKATLAKLQPQSIQKLGKIPKKSSSADKDKSKADKKSEDSTHKPSNKSSISIEVRKKGDGDRPKTVKVFNSKLRSTGLEEAPKPPPSRTAVKKPTATLPSVIPLKRPSPSREAPPPPEKKIKLPEPEEKQTKPGGIKLIPAKPKPAFLQESDMFMDALAASCTNKKDTKKRKRRTSVTKDDKPHNSSSTSSPPTSPSVSNSTISPLSSPTMLKPIAPKFYNDTMETEDIKQENIEKTDVKDEPIPEVKKQEVKTEEEEDDDRPLQNVVKEVDGLRGVLVYHKRRGPKKQVKWKVESELEEVQFFELDETERVNVTKTFTDMKQMEHTGEREALLMCRKLPSEDIMDERTTWKPLITIDLPAALADHGCKSSEKAIQFAREKVVLASLYFNRNMLPDTATEPDIEHQPVTDPVIIPLDDVTGNPDSVNDYQNTPWPEPKGSPPHSANSIPSVPSAMFPGTIPQFTQPIGPANFTGVPQGPFPGPGFGPPNMLGGEWRPMGEGIPDGINHAPMAPFNRPDSFNGVMEDGNFPPQNFGPGPGPMPGPIYPTFNRGSRGGFRGMNRGGWFRPQGPPPGWHGPRGGANHWGGRGGGAGICKQFKMQGFCRNRDNCPFMHPQPNGPY